MQYVMFMGLLHINRQVHFSAVRKFYFSATIRSVSV